MSRPGVRAKFQSAVRKLVINNNFVLGYGMPGEGRPRGGREKDDVTAAIVQGATLQSVDEAEAKVLLFAS